MRGLSKSGAHDREVDLLLPSGTIVLEVELPDNRRGRVALVDFHSDAGWPRRFTISFGAVGEILLSLRHGLGHSTAELNSPEFVAGKRFRMTYCWDAPQRKAQFTLQSLDRFSIHQAAVHDPFPLPLSDLFDIAGRQGATVIDPGVGCVAFADHVAPICLDSGLVQGCRVATPDGYRAIERLQLGDLVETGHRGPMPIRWINRIDLPAMGQFAPIRLSAPFLGLTNDIVMAQSQGVILEGSDAEYLFGSQSVLVRAEDLTSRLSIRQETAQQIVTYHQILLDSHECIDIGGIWAETLYIGQMSRVPGLVRTTALKEFPAADLPRHSQRLARRLRRYEAASLLREMSA